MIHAALLALALGAPSLTQSAAVAPPNMPPPAASSIERCLATMDGAVYHGDPTDRRLMRAAIAACVHARRDAQRTSVETASGPQKLFLIARLLDRTATLSYIGLDDAGSALRDVESANLYFRIAAGVAGESADFRAAAAANVELTNLQLQTLRTEIASSHTQPAAVALRLKPSGPRR
jgi:hypothetical protein